MADLFKELAKIARIDDDDLEDFLQDRLQEGEGEDEDFDPWKDFDFEEQDIEDEIELIGTTYWENISEFGDKTRQIATDIILKFVEGSLGKSKPLPTYVSKPDEGKPIFDLDLDATIEARIDDPIGDVKPWVFERRQSRNPVILLLDTSFSMSGRKLMIAGITVGVLSRLVPSQDLAIIGFSKQTYNIKRFDEELSTYYMIHRIMRILPKGGTNLSEALQKGAELIYQFHPHGKLIILSDMDPTLGKNPIPEASKLREINIMLFPQGNQWLARKLVYESSGEVYPISSYGEIGSIISRIFSSK